ncbi:acidic mammalian chitinase-like isoform X2 [Haliotis rufescens]|uniref:acidic mammalian chitinase-like isoform X2 n=1 Tax=Haliotis rufescens TaxID=6454 RepID=UPI00201E880B|nr:acidic mammalian chitinase-like isoform X2 [Haliotis rufescens]
MHLLVVIVAALLMGVCTRADFKRVCYFTNWSQYRAGTLKFTAANITEPSLCTHYIFAFSKVLPEEDTMAPYEWNDDGPGGNYEQLTSLKVANPGLKVMLAVGGWTHGSMPFVEIVSNDTKVSNFSDNVIKYLRDRNFDGLDLDWEYPAHRGSNDTDRERFTFLAETMMQKFVEESVTSGNPRLLLSTAMPSSPSKMAKAYEVVKVFRTMDFVNLMAYDFDTDRQGLYYVSPLYNRPEDNPPEDILNVNASVQYLLQTGVAPEKIVLGVPLYAREYTVEDGSNFMYGEPIKVNSTATEVYQPQICERLRQGWRTVWDNISMTATIHSGNNWVNPENLRTVDVKSDYIKEHGLGGCMFWELGQEDFGGTTCNGVKNPLLKRFRHMLTSARDDCPPGTRGQVDTLGCVPCGKDTYQEERRRAACIPCPPGFGTTGTGADSRHKCRKFCPLGEDYSRVAGRCEKCRLNYFRSDSEQPFCHKCAPGTITAGVGSTSCVPSPDGLEVEIQQVTLTVTTRFKVVSCQNKAAITIAVQNHLKQAIQTVDRTWRGVCDRDCNSVTSSLRDGCGDGGVLIVDTIVPHVPQEISRVLGEQTTTMSADSLIVEGLYDSSQSPTLLAHGVVFDGVTEVTSQTVCSNQGHVYVNGACEPCKRGAYLDKDSSSCSPCPVGTYQDEAGQTSCMACPAPMTTSRNGADSSARCISPCDADSNYCDGNGICQWDRVSLKVFCGCVDKCQTSSALAPDYRLVIGGAVGGSLALLVFLLLVIGCAVYCSWQRQKEVYKYRADGRQTGITFQDYLDYKLWISSESSMS